MQSEPNCVSGGETQNAEENNVKKGLLVLTVVLLAGCGEEAPKASSVFSVDTQDELVTNTLPAIRQACPGLNKYAGDFQDVRVEEQSRTTIVFHIPERNSIPEAYKADGHNCFVEIENDGRAILIEKAACKSVCLDHLAVPDGQLKLELSSGTETSS